MNRFVYKHTSEDLHCECSFFWWEDQIWASTELAHHVLTDGKKINTRKKEKWMWHVIYTLSVVTHNFIWCKHVESRWLNETETGIVSVRVIFCQPVDFFDVIVLFHQYFLSVWLKRSIHIDSRHICLSTLILNTVKSINSDRLLPLIAKSVSYQRWFCLITMHGEWGTPQSDQHPILVNCLQMKLFRKIRHLNTINENADRL